MGVDGVVSTSLVWLSCLASLFGLPYVACLAQRVRCCHATINKKSAAVQDVSSPLYCGRRRVF